eukprot:10218718-Karenia_brevis.AAC.1
MTLLNSAYASQKKICTTDAEKEIGTTKEKNFEAIKEVVVLEGDHVEANAMFRLGRNAEQN